MKFSESELNTLRERVKDFVSEHRYKHILGVEEAVIYLGNILLPDRISELRAAALLHDVTKEMSIEEQLSLIRLSGEALTEEDKDTQSAIHSFSAVPFIKEKFPLYKTPDVLSSVSKHTLGDESMTLFDKIIYIADYIESGRTYESCITTAAFIYKNLSLENSTEKNLDVLNKAIILEIDFTVKSLLKKNSKVHSRTLITRQSIEKDLI